ncbi:hemerythrin domain-containing protein [Geomonas sp. RF6]|uniref:hemerythrin domain-containing protein n=1 Tax=Geomonas sp. RF6 TaxID=2897342 RepID=UPI001E550784|nr:hemerythrin domain-containing protein [Geomonas sp. RF6]UFS70163.1 hemerythrin domain-containing protein [Geomonas sp. RF6]
MGRLTDDLKKDHADIAAMLEQVKEARSSHKDVHKILLSARNSLLNHLRKEDAHLYPLLNAAAQKDPALKKLLDHYTRDMEEITRNAVTFFDTYTPSGTEHNIDFAVAFGKLYAAIARRLRSEEGTIYREYDKLCP